MTRELGIPEHEEDPDVKKLNPGRVEWVSDDGQRVRVRWTARPGLEDQETTEVASDLRKLAAA